MGINQEELQVKQLQAPLVDSPLVTFEDNQHEHWSFINDEDRILFDPTLKSCKEENPLSFEMAGAREKIYYNSEETTVAIVTCGGLCPGLNDVIRSIVLTLHHCYKVKDIKGIRYGYQGLAQQPDCEPVDLTHEIVSNIHKEGGTILGSSRGTPSTKEIVDTLVSRNINILFTIGGDGTLRGTHEIHTEIEKRRLDISVIGIPKTIDNDIPFVYQTFGFQTAVEEAREVLSCAHVEAKGALNGVGLVKLMGREAGFVAAYSTRSSGDVNYCLIPEVEFNLDVLLNHLRDRLKERRHAVIAVAEGAGKHLIGASDRKDASGNPIFNDIGPFLKQEIKKAFEKWGEPVSVKYFDPSYTIRSIPADSEDSIFCANLGRLAAHAGMAGKTDMFVGMWHGEYTHVPISLIHGKKRYIKPTEKLWRSVLETTGQPAKW